MATLTEEQLLATLENENIPCEDLLAQLTALCEEGKNVRALEWADLLKDTFIDRKALNEAVEVYKWTALQQGTTPAIAQKELLHNPPGATHSSSSLPAPGSGRGR